MTTFWLCSLCGKRIKFICNPHFWARSRSMTRGQREERPYFGLVTYILVAGVKNLYRCLNWGADYLPVAFGWWSWPVRSSLSVYSTGEHFRFLHDDPVVDYLRTGNSLRPATFKRFHTGESSCPCPVFLSYLGLPGDRRPLRQPTILPHLHSYAARCRTTLHTQGHVQSKSKVVDSR